MPTEKPISSGESEPLQVWSRSDSFLSVVPTSGKQGPSWQLVRRRRVLNADTGHVLFDEHVLPSKKKSCYRHKIPTEVLHTVTEFHFRPQEKTSTFECLSSHCQRQLESQVRRDLTDVSAASSQHLSVAEVFCPPRFAPLVEGVGGQCKSFDLTTGYDFCNHAVREKVAEELRACPPDLLILSPPCTDEGGWFNLNSLTMEPGEYLRRVKRSRMFIRFCCRLFKQQVELGGRALIEHPKGSKLWTYPEVQELSRMYELLSCHMCRFGLRIPKSDKLIRKATNLLVSHSDMKNLARECPSKDHPKHACHQVVAGTDPLVGQVSSFAGKYTPQFVEAVMDTIPKFRTLKKKCLVACPVWPRKCEHEVLAAKPDLGSDKSDAELMKVIDKVHRNLGHPPTSDLVRILKHAHASDRAIGLAHKHECSFCKSQIRPHVPLPAKSSRPQEFNQCLGVDVKFLTGWRPNQKVKAVNMVDQASCYQLMVPFFERETSEVIRKIVAEHWIRIFGPPKELVVDAAQTNVGEGLQGYLEAQGCHVHQIPGEAHWQIGRTESHGGWFGRVLDRTLAQFMPDDKETWETCVTHAHVKNTMIQSYGYTPHQYVFGRNPDIPSDLMSEPLHVVPATLGLSEQAIAKSQAIRSAARHAVVETQDDQAWRRAFSARPRLQQQFQAGELVAYWRCQKYQHGQVMLGGRWYGTAVVIGNVGKSYIVAHRKQIFRAAPEQLRPATNEEKAVVTTPQTELLGIRDMIEGGTFKSQQFIDLVPGHYPTESPEMPQEQPRASQGFAETDSSAAPAIPSEAGSPEPSPVPVESQAADNPDASMSNQQSQEQVEQSHASESTDSTYGPLRRVRGKAGPATLYRPPVMREQDFVELMREVVPRMIEQVSQPAEDETAMSGASSHKRTLEMSDEVAEPPSSKPRVNEVLSVEDVSEFQQMLADPKVPIEVMLANYLQKKTNKEVPHSNNDPKVQALVDESKRIEWQTILDKHAVKIHYGKRAQALREKHADRFIGSRFVITKKATEEDKPIRDDDPNSYRIKSRWCLQGHLDPDLDRKVEAGLLQSPTLSQMGRMLLMQLISSFQWVLQLGDIKGAFLEAGPLPAEFRPLLARQPAGGIPGVPPDAILEVTGNVYGQNDAPLAWHRTFHEEACKIGWEQSRFDPCLYFLREDDKLTGIMGVHVDDTALGGTGKKFTDAVAALKARFPYRKWRLGQGSFVELSTDRTLIQKPSVYLKSCLRKN